MAISRAKSRTSGNSLSFQVDMESVIQSLGAGEALVEAIGSKRSPYLDAIVDEAFNRADDVFNVQAAAYAHTGAISHMYEWGTVGINKARTNVRMQPMNPNARLWVTMNQGAGLDRTLWYHFKPSVATVPKPNKSETGMDAEVIAKLRDHTFRWKAEVMEEGRDVTIAPRKAKFLLIPAYKQNRPFMRPNDIKRGYAMTKGPVRVNPGESHYYGNFTAFWYHFWEGRGAELIDEGLEAMVNADFAPEFLINRTARTMTPVGMVSVTSKVEAEKKAVLARAYKRAKQRGISSKEGITR